MAYPLATLDKDPAPPAMVRRLAPALGGIVLERSPAHSAAMVETSQQLVETRLLLERALALVDELEETYLGILIDTALQDVMAKIEALKGDE